MQKPSCLFGGKAPFLEAIYEDWLRDPASVRDEWQDDFKNMPANDSSAATTSSVEARHSEVRERMLEIGARRAHVASRVRIENEPADAQKQVAVLQLINAFRFRGHRQANLDPLNQYDRPQVAELDPDFHGLSDADMDRVFNTGSLQGLEQASLRDILDILRTTYCGSRRNVCA